MKFIYKPLVKHSINFLAIFALCFVAPANAKDVALPKLPPLPEVKEVRGKGLMIGVEFTKDIANDVKYNAADEGLLITAVRPAVIRLVPPLNIVEEDCDKAFEILNKVVSELV